MTFKKEKRQKEVFLLVYTILFSVSAGVMLWYFAVAGKQMVWKGDGLSQHYLALCYYDEKTKVHECRIESIKTGTMYN